MKSTNKLLILLLSLVSIQISAFAFENQPLQGLPSNSVLLNRYYNKPNIPFELSETLKEKKLQADISCLVSQVKKNNLENVELILKAKVNPNQNYLTEYPLYVASKKNNIQMTKLLIDYGAKPDAGVYSELFEAVRNNNQELAQLLLDNGAKVNYIDSFTNRTILYYSLKNKMYKIAQELKEKGAYLDNYSYALIKSKKLEYLFEDTP